MKGQFTFLGTGGSSGVPVITCNCAVCSSTSPYNQRLRSSGLVQIGSKNLLIDAGPDFRMQALREKIQHLHAVFLTHAHADHIAGMDDLRAFYFKEKRKLPCILSQETFKEIQHRFYYMLPPVDHGKSLPAQLDFHLLPNDFGFNQIAGVSYAYFAYCQMEMKVHGFQFGNLAYVSDIRTYEETLLDALQTIDILVLSATRQGPTIMHFNIEEAIAFFKRTSAKTLYLTHISHALDHESTQNFLPKNVYLAYDGLRIPLYFSKEQIA